MGVHGSIGVRVLVGVLVLMIMGVRMLVLMILTALAGRRGHVDRGYALRLVMTSTLVPVRPPRVTLRLSRRAPTFRAAAVFSRSENGTPASTRAPRNMSPEMPEKHSRYAIRIREIVSGSAAWPWMRVIKRRGA